MDNPDIGITIGVTVDTDGVEKGLKEAEEKAKNAGEKSGSAFSTVFTKITGKIKQGLTDAFSKVSGVSKKLLNAVSGIIGVVAKIGIGFGAVGAIAIGLIAAVVILAKAFEKVFEENEQIKADFQYIAFAIGKALEPAINSVANAIVKILNWIIQIVKYTMLFINLWAGRNVFAGASAEAFAKSMANANKNSKKTAQNLKEASKQLAGFDEMNVLGSNTSTGSGGGASTGGGITMPSFDVGDLGGMEVPAWMQWIVDNKDLVVAALLGIAAAIAVVKLSITGLLGGVIVGLIVALVALVIANWDKVKEVLAVVWSWIDEHVIQPIVAIFTWLWNTLKAIFTPIIEFFKSIFTTVYNNIKISIENIRKIFAFLWDKIKEIFGPVVNWFKDKFKAAYDKIKSIFEPLASFFGNLWNKIKDKLKTFGSKVGEVVGGAFKGVVNGVLGAIETVLNKPIKVINSLIDTINEVPGIDLQRLQTFNLPRLAKGGIINMPGKGVPVALGGERGQEGVIPLTDSQQMALLGEAIGRYITVNANITNTMNGRVISRELKRVQNESDFAYNR